MPNCSNMIFEPQGSIVQDDVTSHVTILKFYISLVRSKSKSAKLLTSTCHTKFRDVCCLMTCKSRDYLKILYFACVLLSQRRRVSNYSKMLAD